MGNTQNSRNNCIYILYHKIFRTKFTRLILAIRRGNLAKVIELHKKGLNFNQFLENGDTPLHLATRHKHKHIIRYICQNVPSISVNDKNNLGDFPLLIAVMNGDFELIKFFVDINADLNMRENRGFTPFIAACAYGDVKIVQYLADLPDINIKLRTNDSQNGLHRAAFYGNLDVIKYLVRDLGISIYALDKKGNIPLHYACMELNISCARYLYKKCVDGSKILRVNNREGISSLEYLKRLFLKLKENDDNSEYSDKDIEDYLRDMNNIPNKFIVIENKDKDELLSSSKSFSSKKIGKGSLFNQLTNKLEINGIIEEDGEDGEGERNSDETFENENENESDDDQISNIGGGGSQVIKESTSKIFDIIKSKNSTSEKWFDTRKSTRMSQDIRRASMISINSKVSFPNNDQSPLTNLATLQSALLKNRKSSFFNSKIINEQLQASNPHSSNSRILKTRGSVMLFMNSNKVEDNKFRSLKTMNYNNTSLTPSKVVQPLSPEFSNLTFPTSPTALLDEEMNRKTITKFSIEKK